jgi:hypothetical protein
MKHKLLLTIVTLPLLGAATQLVPADAGGNPLTRYGLGAASRYTLCGQVEERLPAGSYLYLRVREATGDSHWVATLRSTAAATHQVEVKVMARAEHFASRRLGRDFAPLHFGAVSGVTSCRTESTPSQESNP